MVDEITYTATSIIAIIQVAKKDVNCPSKILLISFVKPATCLWLILFCVLTKTLRAMIPKNIYIYI